MITNMVQSHGLGHGPDLVHDRGPGRLIIDRNTAAAEAAAAHRAITEVTTEN